MACKGSARRIPLVMVEMLDISEVRARVATVSLDRYHGMIDAGDFGDRKVELLNGILVEKMTKSALHVFLVRSIADLLEEHCDLERMIVRQENPVTVPFPDRDSQPEPDISVVLGQDSDFKFEHPSAAQFVVEVAISSANVDLAKSGIYATAGVEEYWIVRPEQRVTEVFRNPVDGEYSERVTVDANELLPSTALPGFELNLADLLDE